MIIADISLIPDFLKPLVKLLAIMLPYALIPLTYKFAGGIFATFTGMVGDKTKGFSERQQASRAAKKERFGRRVLAKRAGANRYLQEKASSDDASWARRKTLRGLARGVGGYNIEAAASARQAAVGKEVNDQIATGRDEDVRGLTVDKKFLRAGGFEAAQKRGLAQVGSNGNRQYKSLGGAWIDEANVVAGHKRWGNDRFAQQTALSYEMRKAMTSEQVAGVSARYKDVADGWGMSKTEAGGAWIGSAFENQNQHLEYKSTDWTDGSLNGAKFVDEVYEKKGNYPLGQMSAHTIEQLSSAYSQAEASGDTDGQRKIREIAETFEFRTQQGEGGEPTGGPATGGGSSQVSAPGSAAVNKAVKDLHALTRLPQAPRAPREPQLPPGEDAGYM